MIAQRQLLYNLLEWAGLRRVECNQAVSSAEASSNFLITIGKGDIAKCIVVRQGVKVTKPSTCTCFSLDSLAKLLPVNAQFLLYCLQGILVRGVLDQKAIVSRYLATWLRLN